MLSFRAFLAEAFKHPTTLDAVKALLRPVSNFDGAGSLDGAFILPDGSRWHSGVQHAYSFLDPDDESNPHHSFTRAQELAFWKTCQTVGLVLVHGKRAYECQSSITSAQADRMVYEYGLTNAPGHEPEMLYIDVQKGGMPVDSKIFNDRVSASALRTWVNAHF